MSMADDNTLRSYRSNDPYRRSEPPADAQADDPLAELVRLIGQPDPFTDNPPRHPQPGASRAPQAGRADPQTARRGQADEPGDWRRHVQRPNFEAREEPRFESDPRYGSADPYGAASEPASPPFATDHDPYRIAPRPSDPRYADPRYSDPRYADPRYNDPQGDYHQESSYAVPSVYADEPMFDADPRYGETTKGRRHAGRHADAETRNDEDYDDPPRRRRGNSLVTAAVLIGCAMLGTAGAYSYRTYMATSGPKQAPVIIADTSPSKVVPAERKSPRSQDRVGGQAGDEQLVSREEQPVSLSTPGSAAVPRVVFPSPVQATQPAPSSTGSTPPPRASNAQASPSGNATDEPKRVRTVTIRPEAASGAPVSDGRALPPAARSAAPPVAPRASRDEPLSLDPVASVPSEPRAQPRARETAPSEPRLASIPPSSGGYMVQVSSQRSESDAQASFKALQDKYSQLRSRQLVVRRADLGSRGIYYRAMIGPFGSSEEAHQLCNSLKQSGGQCIIQRN
jgi:SPOR domain